MKRKHLKKQYFLIIAGLILAIIITLVLYPKDTAKKEPTPKKVTNEYASVDYYNSDYLEKYQAYKTQHSDLSISDIVTHVNMHIDSPFYEDIIPQDKPDDLNTIVNKVYKLDSSYAPSDLVNINDDFSGQYAYSYRNHQARQVVYNDFVALRNACKEKGFELYVVSGYRSYAWQEEIYNHNAEVYSVEETDKTVSRPGHSEHTLGLGMDVALDSYKFQEIENHPQYQWFLSQLADYGFILRYPEGKESLTGYTYEQWHIRYLGKDLAKKVVKSGLTYDEYYARHY